MRGKRFGELRRQLFELDDAIVDVGASNVEDFLALMQQYTDSPLDFDLFVVPVVKEKKQQMDATDSPREDFPAIFGLAAVDNSFIANPLAAIHTNEVFDGIKDVQRSITDLANDPIDYRAKLKTLTDPDERSQCVHIMGLKMLAISATKDMDRAFAALTA